MATPSLSHTPLHAWHVEHGGRMVDFAGWEMPVQYTSIVEEHNAVRSSLGLFDVSHMGRLQFSGSACEKLLDKLLTRRVRDMLPGDIRYSLVCQEEGGILDDVLVYRLLSQAEATEVEDDQPAFQLVVNASNRQKIVSHFHTFVDATDRVRMSDLTTVTAMIAVQGPRAIELLDPLVDFELTQLANYHGTYSEVEDKPCYVSRTGYTGEDGAEIICSANYAEPIWELLMDVGKDAGIAACGLAARDTLRLEAAMPLYGHELSEAINPVQAGLGFGVNVKDREFVGRDAIVKARKQYAEENHNLPVRVGLELGGKRPAREGATILNGDNVVGKVTSGTFSPTLEKPIAMGYVTHENSVVGTELAIDIRGKQHAAKIVKLPFYKRK
ncbi:glycine cleavage system aminomethyltransferase GcvT [Adhaeretor mobilis]|uniref:Aminomethyltransferase n=1 Tax=Adhaeretor mobilis TaxID=1930276 RepID=A0A517N237_9BACT|nr:glycine cleavage system aminomethyltransferase GcvT [Adhaeretor mobilis]QDT01209.1 Glycine cleavage system T protein [Adhaeretor mobilis]